MELIQDGPLLYLTPKAQKAKLALNLTTLEDEAIWVEVAEATQFELMSLVYLRHMGTQ